MTETDETGDLLEEPEAEGESLVVSLSRRVGGLARTASDSLRSVSAAFAARPPAEQGSQELAADLEELGALVASYRERGYAALEQDDAFWKLIARLGGAMPRKRAKRLAKGDAATKLRKRGRVRKRLLDGAKPKPAPGAGKGSSPPKTEEPAAAATEPPPASGKAESAPPEAAAGETNKETAAEAEAPPADGDDSGHKTSK